MKANSIAEYAEKGRGERGVGPRLAPKERARTWGTRILALCRTGVSDPHSSQATKNLWGERRCLGPESGWIAEVAEGQASSECAMGT